MWSNGLRAGSWSWTFCRWGKQVGNDSHDAVDFLRVGLEEMRGRFVCRLPLEVRMVGALFLPQVLRFLNGEADVAWAMKVAVWK